VELLPIAERVGKLRLSLDKRVLQRIWCVQNATVHVQGNLKFSFFVFRYVYECLQFDAMMQPETHG
jgi:hypothetical protein